MGCGLWAGNPGTGGQTVPGLGFGLTAGRGETPRQLAGEDARPTKGGTMRPVGAGILDGRPFNAVITTFITHEFNRGPWTSAV